MMFLLVYMVNNLNDPSAGLLDNDPNGDGIPDFIISVNDLRLKPRVYPSEEELRSSIAKDGMCFGVSIDVRGNETFVVRMHFDDSETSLGRTQSNVPRPDDYSDGEPKVDAHRKYIQQGYLWVQNWLANYVLREVTGE